MRQSFLLYQKLITHAQNHRYIYILGLMLLFWNVFDGIVAYLTPIVIVADGYSATVMGLIYGTSSISGAVFDIVLTKVLKNTHYRRLYLLMFIICFIFPLIMWNAKSLPMFLILMALWGIYYDLKNFGTFDFITRYTDENESASTFGFIGLTKILGYLIAPIIVGFVVGETLSPTPFVTALFFLLVSFTLYIYLTSQTGADMKFAESSEEKGVQSRNFLSQLSLLRKFDHLLAPVIVFLMLLSMFEAFFWTVGPFYIEDSFLFKLVPGLFMIVYIFPQVIGLWNVGKLTSRFGKKRTAFTSTLFASALLLPLWFEIHGIALLIVVGCASLLNSFAWPAVEGAVSDYLSETEKYDKEVSGLTDLYTNLGWVIGPPIAGFLLDQVGIQRTLAVLGIFGVLLSAALLWKGIHPIDVNSIEE